MLFQLWFKNRRAKWRKQKREEQERIRKMQDEHHNGLKVADELSQSNLNLSSSLNNFSEEEDSSDLEVA